MGIMRNFKGNVLKIAAVFLILLIISATSLNAEDKLLKTIPEESLFAVRINNLQGTLGQVDQFMMGTGGMMGSASMLVRMSLAGALGDPMLKGVDMNGNFGLFGISEEGSGMFVAFLVPVANYEEFISGKDNYEAPDENKITKITTTGMSGKGSTMLMGEVGNYAVLTKEDNYEKLAAFIKSQPGKGDFLSTLGTDETKRATSEQVWAYINIEQVSKLFGPVIKEGMEKAKGNMPEGMGNFQDLMNEYIKVIDMFLNEVKFVSNSLEAGPEALEVRTKVATVPGTEMAGLLQASDSADEENELLGYLEDGAVINFGAKSHKGLMNKMKEIGMNFFKSFAGGGEIDQEAQTKIETIMKEWSNAMGRDIAFSWLRPKGESVFNFVYVVGVADKEKFDKVIDDGMSLYEEAGIWDMYKKMGIKADYEVEEGADTYKGVSIDAAKLNMEATDANAPEAQMITAMYKGGFDYRWAMVKDKWVCAVGADADSKVCELIDSALADSDKQMPAEMKEAMGLIPGAEKADFVGTINYIRLLNMFTKMAPIPLPVMDIETKSNMVFAGRIGSGQLQVDVVMPKEHMQEIMKIQQMIMQQQMQQQMMKQQQMQQQGDTPGQPPVEEK